MNDTNHLDPEALERLRQWGGDDLLVKISDLFLTQTPERMGQIRDGIARGDASLVERGSHSLKSTAANLGARGLRDVAATIEDLAYQGSLDDIPTLLPRLEEEYGRAVAAVRALLKD